MVHIYSSSFEKTILNHLLLWELGWVDEGFPFKRICSCVSRESDAYEDD